MYNNKSNYYQLLSIVNCELFSLSRTKAAKAKGCMTILVTCANCFRAPAMDCFWKSCASSKIELTQKLGYFVLPLVATCCRFLACRNSQSATVKCPEVARASNLALCSGKANESLEIPSVLNCRAIPGRAQQGFREFHCSRAFDCTSAVARESRRT